MELQTFASGDTDYIAKLNQNVAELTAAINALQTQVGAVAGSDALSVGMFFDALFNGADALIGPGSYKATKSVSTLTIAPGGMYLQGEHLIVTLFDSTPISFIGQSANTYYIVVGTAGIPIRTTTLSAGAIYSVYWSGSAFGDVTYLVPIFFDTTESDAARKSVALATNYPTLDARLEAGELQAVEANEAAIQALAVAYELEDAIPVPIRKVGITVDATGGVKGAIQIDFDGTIIGWSVIADAVGSLQVEVDRKASGDPPAAPAIPNTTTDKISASAPINLSGAQSASADESDVSSWDTSLQKWDVLQFNVVGASVLTKATMYVRILEDLPSPPALSSP